MCSCKSHATLCSFPFILCRWCMCACCICARMHVCARAQWLLMAIDELGSALHIQVHMTHIVGKSRIWNCMFASSTRRNQLQLRAISLSTEEKPHRQYARSAGLHTGFFGETFGMRTGMLLQCCWRGVRMNTLKSIGSGVLLSH